MTATEAMERSGNEAMASRSGGAAASRDRYAPAADNARRTPKRRRKPASTAVDLTDVDPRLRRTQERPCTRCIKRNIGHLCHDEPRDYESRRSKSLLASSTVRDSGSQPDLGASTVSQSTASLRPPSFDAAMGNGPAQITKAAFDAAALASRGSPLQLVQPTTVPGIQASTLGSSINRSAGFSDAWLASQSHFHDMHNFHPNYVVAPEVTNEYNLLSDFLQTSLLDHGAPVTDDQNQDDAGTGLPSSSAMLPPSAAPGGSILSPNAEQAKTISRPGSTLPTDKARDYYLQAADPSGTQPEERMRQVLQAKYDAGLLKPFNYVKGYTRLSTYLDMYVTPSSKQKVLRQLDRFRPKFREKIKDLTDMDLVLVEMWFERTLMDYERVFASMAVPACCWRRTGEIFRGNKEMAELIGVPVEDLRGGKIALHEILTEESNVRYWEEFGTIAFDSNHDTLLTACSLQNPYDETNRVLNCCFSFRIRRDDHKMQVPHGARSTVRLLTSTVRV
ncbi:Regulator of drug sensitivity 2 [Madurella mycetomatis]|uniref:Regulator of drug sensitivity 2 n=1 Tax=Madurella mycetomatis TaxID=100816 RepID=A0A175VR18_9PEZI|nr:Regulator of drug sensitivity 2 [Madurella mycetomatis]